MKTKKQIQDDVWKYIADWGGKISPDEIKAMGNMDFTYKVISEAVAETIKMLQTVTVLSTDGYNTGHRIGYKAGCIDFESALRRELIHTVPKRRFIEINAIIAKIRKELNYG